jgi:hypothetical protein
MRAGIFLATERYWQFEFIRSNCTLPRYWTVKLIGGAVDVVPFTVALIVSV